MAVPTAWGDLSTTAASNPPAGTDQRSVADDHLRQVYAYLRGLFEGQTGGQIQFPATQNASAGANVLDDYEEGTWTPAITGDTISLTYSDQNGTYTKIGRLVYVEARIVWTAKAGSGTLQFSGLPFANGATRASGSIGLLLGVTTPGGQMTLQCDVSQNYAAMWSSDVSGGASTAITSSHLANSGEVQFSMVYRV